MSSDRLVLALEDGVRKQIAHQRNVLSIPQQDRLADIKVEVWYVACDDSFPRLLRCMKLWPRGIFFGEYVSEYRDKPNAYKEVTSRQWLALSKPSGCSTESPLRYQKHLLRCSSTVFPSKAAPQRLRNLCNCEFGIAPYSAVAYAHAISQDTKTMSTVLRRGSCLPLRIFGSGLTCRCSQRSYTACVAEGEQLVGLKFMLHPTLSWTHSFWTVLMTLTWDKRRQSGALRCIFMKSR